MIITQGRKIPIETLPLDVRVHIYEFGDVDTIIKNPRWHRTPWMRTILLSGILNDKEGLDLVAIQDGEPRQIICTLIALIGNLPALKWARLDRISSSADDPTVGAGIVQGSSKRVRFEPLPWDVGTCASAAAGGHLKLLMWARESHCPWNAWTCTDAAKGGHFELLKWAREQGCPWNFSCYRAAAHCGRLDILQWLHSQKCPTKTHGRRRRAFGCSNLMGNCNLEMIQWLHQQGFLFNKYSLSTAAEGGHLEVLQWLHEEKNVRFNEHLASDACRGGHIHVLEWLINKQFPLLSGCFPSAAGGGHIDVLEWLRKKEYRTFREAAGKIFNAAAANGQVKVLNWLLEKDEYDFLAKQYSAGACPYAAFKGKLNVLKWFHEKKCPMDEKTFTAAARAEVRNMHVLKWLYQIQAPWNEDACAAAAFADNFETLQWLHEQGCPWDSKTTYYATQTKHKVMLDWAISRGCPNDGKFSGGVRLDFTVLENRIYDQLMSGAKIYNDLDSESDYGYEDSLESSSEEGIIYWGSTNINDDDDY